MRRVSSGGHLCAIARRTSVVSMFGAGTFDRATLVADPSSVHEATSTCECFCLKFGRGNVPHIPDGMTARLCPRRKGTGEWGHA
jgi:hypothetical protein